MNHSQAAYSPVMFDASHLTAAEFDEPLPSFSQLMISLPLEDLEDEAPSPVKSVRHEPYPSPKSPQQPRRRRKREAIDIPEEIAGHYDPSEVKKIKNRIAAARLRERSQQKIRDLEAEVLALRERNAVLESRAAQCNQCSTCTTAAPTKAVIPCSPQPVVATPPPTRCQSPSTLDDGAAMTQQQVMQEFEQDLLHQLLWHSEELAAALRM